MTQRVVLVTVALFIGGVGSVSIASSPPVVSARAEPPRLVVLLVVDQLRQDYLEKLRPHLTGGFAGILDRGVEFKEAHHEHAYTATAPGHSAIVTGLHPGRSGIVGNYWFDRQAEEWVYSVEDEGARPLKHGLNGKRESKGSRDSGRSPRNLQGTGLPDWMQQGRRGAKAFSIGGKDRSTILMGGQQPTGAYWYDFDKGHFITTTHYVDSYPEWVTAFVEREDPARTEAFLTPWRPLPVSRAVERAFGLRPVDTGDLNWALPRSLGGLSSVADDDFYSDFGASPFFEGHLLKFAREVIRAESLGRDASTDYLAVNLSVLDYVGHRHGPHSVEVLDTLLRLDADLGRFLQFLDREVGRERVILALTSDHGVRPYPEVVGHGRRMGATDVLCLRQLEGALDERFGDDRWLLADGYLNYQALGRRNVRRQDVEGAARRHLERCEAIERVWTRTELEQLAAAAHGPADSVAARFVNGFHPERSGDLIVQLKAGRLDRLWVGTTHGTHHAADSHVPLVIVAPGLQRRVVHEAVATVDLAPTLAALIGIEPPAGLDGRDLRPLLFGARRR